MAAVNRGNACLTILNPIVVPARGGVGEVVEYQANVIASVLAERLRGYL